MELYKDSFNRDVNKISECISELKKESKDITNDLSALKRGWKGEKANEFYSIVETKYLVELNKAIEELSKYEDYMKGIPTIYETFDSNYANKKIDV